MKNLLALALSLAAFTSPSAFALQEKLASVNQLEADAKNFSLMIGEGQGCSLRVQKSAGGIRVAMHSEAAGYAWLDIRNDNAVVLSETYQDDGSYVKAYEIPGQGKFTALIADDSYFQATMETHGKTISCEIDF